VRWDSSSAGGSFSAAIGRQVGLSLDIYPAKGYCVTLPVLDASKAPSVSLTDDEFKLVFSRLGDRLRIAGTAELNGYDMLLNRLRCEAIVRRALEVFPAFSRAELAGYWTGLRPGHSRQRALDRPQSRIRALSQYRSRHSGLDARLRLGESLGAADVRENTRGRFQLELIAPGVADKASLVTELDPWQGGAAP